jgi:hypothetical protein
MALPTNYNQNKYLAVTFRRGSEYIEHPSNLAMSIPDLQYIGQIGQLKDAHLYGIPLAAWATFNIGQLDSLRDVTSVRIQEPKIRTKRGGGEL